MKKNYNIFLIIAIPLFILTFSITVTFYARSFYFLQFKNIKEESIYPRIETLKIIYNYNVTSIDNSNKDVKEKEKLKKIAKENLENELKKYTDENVKNSYNEMMDYVLGISNKFKAGTLSYSKSGRDHFTDVRELFKLNNFILIISLTIIIVTYYFKFKESSFFNFKKVSPELKSIIILILSIVIILILSSINFDSAFIIFHKIFFPGKDNWQFDTDLDEIINILPISYFRNCAILILSISFLLIMLFFIFGLCLTIIKNKKLKKLINKK